MHREAKGENKIVASKVHEIGIEKIKKKRKVGVENEFEILYQDKKHRMNIIIFFSFSKNAIKKTHQL